jgi:hypothetical protein
MFIDNRHININELVHMAQRELLPPVELQMENESNRDGRGLTRFMPATGHESRAQAAVGGASAR